MIAQGQGRVRTVLLTGEGREAQAQAQAEVTTEILRTDITPRYALMVNYATGSGKGKAAIDAAIALYDQGICHGPIFIGCFTKKSRDSVWVKQFEQWGNGIAHWGATCYASMSRDICKQHKHYGLVILDEAQHLTPNSYEFFEHNTWDAILILTATVPRDKQKRILINRLTGGRKLILDVEDAIGAKVLNDFRVQIILLDFDTTEKRKLFQNANTLYTEEEGYLKYCSLLTHAKQSGNRERIKFAAINRMRYMGNLKTKTLAAMYIQERFREKELRFVTFANSKAQADSLGPYVYHSSTTDLYYKKFLANEINELISINQIRESENFENLGRGLAIQMNCNYNAAKQQIGRLLRLEVGEISEFWILCIKGTADYDWITKALSTTESTKISMYTLPREVYWK